MFRSVSVISALIFLLSTSVKAEELGSFYLGAGITGVNKINNESTLTHEVKGITFVNEKTNEKKPVLDSELFLGFKIGKNYAVELSYDGENRNNLYIKSGFATYDNDISKTRIPYNLSLESRFSAFQLSLVGEKEINDYFSVFGRVGMIYSKTKWKQKIFFDNHEIPDQIGTSSSTRISALLGLGLTTQLINQVFMRTEVVKSVGLNGVLPKISLIYSF